MVEVDAIVFSRDEEKALLNEWFETVGFDKPSKGIPELDAEPKDPDDETRSLDFLDDTEERARKRPAKAVKGGGNPNHDPHSGKFASGGGVANSGATDPKFLQSKQDADKWVASQAFPTPTGHAEEAVRFYGEKGYQHMNSSLREGKTTGLGTQEAYDMKKHIKTSVTKTPVTVRRMTELHAFPDSPDKLVGTVIKDKGFLSTTILPSAEHYDHNQWWDSKGVIMDIHVPAGSQAMYMPNNMARVKGQHELILNASTGIKFTSAVRRPDGKWLVTGEAIPAPVVPGRRF